MDLAFEPARGSDAPIFRQLADRLEALVRADRLAPGAKLPATRELAAALGLGRNTVTRAYERLIVGGLFTARVGQGTFVVAPPTRSARAPQGARPSSARGFVWAGLFARRTRALAVPPALRDDAGGRFDFRGGQVDGASLPGRDLAWAFGRACARASRLRELAAHRDPFGWPPLRREIARHLVSRGIACAPEDVAVVSGAQQAIDLAARVLVDPGDVVAVEQPGYFGATLAFAACQAHLVGIGVYAEGLRTAALARVLRSRRVKLLYVTPATQSPTGAVLAEARRRELLALADEHQMPILEDDYDAELRYAGPALPALKTRDQAGQIIYVGTFSKILFPALRLGYVVAPRPLLEKMVLARWLADFGTGVVEQEALATLLRTRGLERHLKRLRRLYAERRDAMLIALRAAMPAGTAWSEPRGGQAVWVTLPPGADAARIYDAARARGVAYTRGEAFFVDGRGAAHLMLAFTPLDADAIAEGVAELGRIVRRHVRVRSTAGRRTAARAERRRTAHRTGGDHVTTKRR
jgi:DNA-binding transcriptional MocR family regulator